MRAAIVASSPALSRMFGSRPAPQRLGDVLVDALDDAGCRSRSSTLGRSLGSATSARRPVPAARRREPPGRRLLMTCADSLARELFEAWGGPARAGDVVHALDPVAAAVALSARSRLGGRVVVRAQADPTAGTLDRLALRAADAVTAPTPEDVRRAVRAGAPHRRVVLCPDDTLLTAQFLAEQAESEPADLAVAEFRPGTAPYLLLVSGVPERERVRGELLRVLRRCPSLRLVVTRQPTDPGPGGTDTGGTDTGGRGHAVRATAHRDATQEEDAERFLREAAACGVRSRVKLRGQARGRTLVRLVDEARLVVSARSDRRNSLIALAAMHRCRPVVSVRGADPDDVLVDGVTGLLVDPAVGHELSDAICRVVEDDFLSLALGMAGQDRAETRFAPEVVVRSLLDAYHRAGG